MRLLLISPFIRLGFKFSMSTYLQLCQDTQRECRITGTSIGTVTGNTGQLERVVYWVKDSWTEIQQRYGSWRWMRSTFTVNTVISTDKYASTACTDDRLAVTINRFSHWWPTDYQGYSNFKSQLTSSGVGSQRWLIYLDWSDFRAIYRIGTQTPGQPAHFTIDPQNNIVLGPVPNAIYTITGEYQLSPQILAANADVPEMPSQFHQIIVFKAMTKYGAGTSAPEVSGRGISEGNSMMRALEINQMISVQMAGPLA